MSDHVYLDFNASTPLRPCVMEVMTEAMAHFGNPSSVHKFGRSARSLLETARDTVAAYFGVEPVQVVFTSGGTEANNIVIKAHSQIFKSAIEHESVDRSSPHSPAIPVTKHGTMDLDALEQSLEKDALISLMLANNETGIIQPIKEVVEIARKHGCKVHCDAVTALGKIPTNYRELGVDYLTVSAHKIGGPKGCGALILPEREQLASQMHGGGQERGHRAGTENVIGIIGFARALEDTSNDDWAHIRSLRDKMETMIPTHVYGKDVERLPNTSYLAMAGVSTHKQLMAFDIEGYAVSSGSACSSGKVKPSHVLKAMGYSDEEASEALRVSLGWTTTEAEIEGFAKTWVMLNERFKMNG